MATRRSNREGSITKLPSGSWRVIIMDGYTKDGKRNMVSFTAPTRTAAVQKMRKYQYERENDLIVARSKDNQFGTWADSWYEDHKTQVQPSTYSGYLYTLNLLGGFSYIGQYGSSVEIYSRLLHTEVNTAVGGCNFANVIVVTQGLPECYCVVNVAAIKGRITFFINYSTAKALYQRPYPAIPLAIYVDKVLYCIFICNTVVVLSFRSL